MIALNGFRISCAILAVRRPRDASLICWVCSESLAVSSRNMSVALLALSPRRVKRGITSLVSGVARKACVSVILEFFHERNNLLSTGESVLSVFRIFLFYQHR